MKLIGIVFGVVIAGLLAIWGVMAFRDATSDFRLDLGGKCMVGDGTEMVWAEGYSWQSDDRVLIAGGSTDVDTVCDRELRKSAKYAYVVVPASTDVGTATQVSTSSGHTSAIQTAVAGGVTTAAGDGFASAEGYTTRWVDPPGATGYLNAFTVDALDVAVVVMIVLIVGVAVIGMMRVLRGRV